MFSLRHAVRAVILPAGLVLACASGAAAKERCRVTDPTGTPLNVRTGPNGKIVGKVRNGKLVTTLEYTSDRSGRPWVYVADYKSEEPIGWVYREFVSCF